MKKKERVQWGVTLHHYNLSKEFEIYPRAIVRDTLTLYQLAEELERRSHGRFKAAETELFINILTDIAEDVLIDGYALSTPLGTLTPTVTGMWNFDRIQPTARKQNKATLSFALSKRMKGLLTNPLFHDEPPRSVGGPAITEVRDLKSQQVNHRLTPGGYIIVKGRMLLMNGDTPQRGMELVRVDTGEVAVRFAPEELELNTRARFGVHLPVELPDGEYRMAVTSQCCTKPTPLRKPVRRVSSIRLWVGEEPSAENELATE